MDKKISSHCIRIYFNDEEYALLSEHETVLGISKQQLVRKVLIEKAGPSIINARELLGLFDDIGAKISASNELIYARLSGKAAKAAFPDPEAGYEESFSEIISEYLSVLKNLEQAIRLLLFKMKT